MAKASAPAALAMYETARLRPTSATVILRVAQAVASRQLPVESSAPDAQTSSSPQENTTPPSRRDGPCPRDETSITPVKKAPPTAINAPAKTPSMTSRSVEIFDLAVSQSSSWWAVWAGVKSPNEINSLDAFCGTVNPPDLPDRLMLASVSSEFWFFCSKHLMLILGHIRVRRGGHVKRPIPGFPVRGDHRFRWMTTTCSGRWRPGQQGCGRA